MKKILVLSDSHGEVLRMQKALEKEKPDLIIHLGDCTRDADTLRNGYPSIPMISVPGNCDFSKDEPVHQFEYEGLQIMACHGHTYRVKLSYLTISMAAKERDARICLFGHTHRVFYEDHNGVLLMNPGSIGSPLGAPPSYGIIQIDKDTQTLHYDVQYMADGE